jgi:cell filamentation protein
VRISKGGSLFCYPEYIENEMQGLFSGLSEHFLEFPLTREEFAKHAAVFL